MAITLQIRARRPWTTKGIARARPVASAPVDAVLVTAGCSLTDPEQHCGDVLNGVGRIGFWGKIDNGKRLIPP